MRIITPFLAFLLLSCFALAANPPQEQFVSVNATQAPALVEVRGGLDFPYFVPDVENRANVTIGLPLSKMSLSSIASGNIIVYVLVHPKRNDSLLYFGGNPDVKSYYLTLNCTVEGSSCSPDSITERTIEVYFKASSDAQLSSDGIVFQASVNPLISEPGDLSGRIIQAASGLLGLAGQAATATTGVLSDISVTVTTNSSSPVTSNVSNTTSSNDTIAIQAVQDSASTSNQSETGIAQEQKKDEGTQNSVDLPSAIGMFSGAIARPEVAGAIVLVMLFGYMFLRYRGKGYKPSGGKGGYLDFDGL